MRNAECGVPARHCQAGDRRAESVDTSEAAEDLPIWPGADNKSGCSTFHGDCGLLVTNDQ